MQKLIMIVLVIWGIAGGLRFLNTNYDGLTSGLGQVFANDKAARATAREDESTANLAMISDAEYLLVDAPLNEVKTRYAVQTTINTDVRGKAETSADAFFENAAGGGRDWSGASVRLQSIQGFNVWVTDIKEQEAEVAVAGINNATFSGRIIRALATTSKPPAPIGRRITFRQTQMWDWAITHQGQVYGLYTIRDNLENLPPEVVALTTANLSAAPIPADW